MDFRTSRTLMWIGLLLAFLMMAIGTAAAHETITGGLMVVGTILFLLSFFQASLFYRCPHCGYSLMNVRGSIPGHCPKCGKALNE